MNPGDASARGLQTGDVIRLYNDRGSCLAGLHISEAIMAGVIELPTGAWFDPQDWEGGVLEVHGNPNALTPDIGTSSLAQGVRPTPAWWRWKNSPARRRHCRYSNRRKVAGGSEPPHRL